MKRIYLDYAAATPLKPEVLQAMRPFWSQNFYNPSATYLAGRGARRALDEQRAKVARVLGARPAEIVFTAGATEANNLAVQGVMHQYPAGEALVSAIEHDSVLAPAELFKCRRLPVDKDGLIILNKLSNLITDKTVLISVMLVNNELGTIQPVREVSGLIKDVLDRRRQKGDSTPLYLHTDAAQAANFLDLHVSRLGADLMSLNGGKIYGPKQSGCLYVKAGTKLKPLIVGGRQEFNLRSGTENLAGCAGFAKALELSAADRAAETKRLTELRLVFEAQLADKIPGIHINGSAKHRAPHITSLTIDGTDNERLMFELDERGIDCAVGSACSAGNDEPSRVLTAIGLGQAQARATLRFSLGRLTAKADLQKTADILASLVSKQS
ncbi:MAG TPA: cysteine desulfurase family protein [Candidatus Saccharimonadales bacterium]|nr:cysteine desulfurase family protein [Candidatus Saccharimonadales bacterium]